MFLALPSIVKRDVYYKVGERLSSAGASDCKHSDIDPIDKHRPAQDGVGGRKVHTERKMRLKEYIF